MRNTPYRILAATLLASGALVLSAPAGAQAVDEDAAKVKADGLDHHSPTPTVRRYR